MAEKEAAGASFWTASFDDRVRARILHCYQDACGYHVRAVSTHAKGLILRDEGLLNLLTGDFYNEDQELMNFLLRCDEEMVPTVIEAMGVAIQIVAQGEVTLWGGGAKLNEGVGVVLREHRISYDLVEGQMVEFSSKELHESLVSPTLRLLAGRPDLTGVETAYQAALGEISKGASGDAVTDAGTALQELLKALECTGNSLGPLISSARKKGLLGGHDTPMLDAIAKVLQWVSADRSESGDSHSAQEPSIDDAWLIVHIVGAIILRLAQPSQRGG